MRVAAVAFCLTAGLLCGCSSGQPSPLGERVVVKGKVTAGGQAVGKGQVVLTPVDPSKGDEQTGDLNPSGEYITSVFPGKYKVSVTGNASVPTALRSAKTTTLEVEIPKGGKNDATFDLK
jgi:hypothetical protein